jgi:hypothetical protein
MLDLVTLFTAERFPSKKQQEPRDLGLAGFTLFKTGRGWQKSICQKGEPGWEVEVIPFEEAEALLSLLNNPKKDEGAMSFGLLTAIEVTDIPQILRRCAHAYRNTQTKRFKGVWLVAAQEIERFAGELDVKIAEEKANEQKQLSPRL